MKKILGVFLLICSMLFGIVPSYAETTHDIDLLVEPYLTTMKEFNQEMGTQFFVYEEDKEDFYKVFKEQTQDEFWNSLLEEMQNLTNSAIQVCSVEGDTSQMSGIGYNTYVKLNNHVFQIPPSHAIYNNVYGVELVYTSLNGFVIKPQTGFQISVSANRQTCTVSFTGYPYNYNTKIAQTVSIKFNSTFEAEI